MSGEQQPALSAQAEEDAMRGFYNELSGTLGADGARRLSGLKTSTYTAFRYARKIIFREEVPRVRKGNNAGTAADAPGREITEPEVDEDDSGTEGDTESDAELPSARVLSPQNMISLHQLELASRSRAEPVKLTIRLESPLGLVSSRLVCITTPYRRCDRFNQQLEPPNLSTRSFLSNTLKGARSTRTRCCFTLAPPKPARRRRCRRAFLRHC
ncbi:hypothetical protein FN846DRAFT_894032 [Sphaerosporella brunnea]|uniref:Uncharacterized protein n=1 Tax=Sphaerosporella brunnea TaxID=1250544 RepID=A0A5J5ELH1_9PEZI|nr:hypothetical protein FN846DRAFT_894032 [Sphaerosporella brunnea]